MSLELTLEEQITACKEEIALHKKLMDERTSVLLRLGAEKQKRQREEERQRQREEVPLTITLTRARWQEWLHALRDAREFYESSSDVPTESSTETFETLEVIADVIESGVRIR